MTELIQRHQEAQARQVENQLSPSAARLNERIQRESKMFATRPDSAVVYAGPLAAAHGFWERTPTHVLARQDGGQKIFDTAGGRWLTEATRSPEINDRECHQLWRSASRCFAEQAEGHVACFVPGATEQSAYRSVELPCLLINEKVTHINGIPREKLLKTVEEQYRAHGESGLAAGFNDCHRQIEAAMVAEKAQEREQAANRVEPSAAVLALRKEREQREAVFQARERAGIDERENDRGHER